MQQVFLSFGKTDPMIQRYPEIKIFVAAYVKIC